MCMCLLQKREKLRELESDDNHRFAKQARQARSINRVWSLGSET